MKRLKQYQTVAWAAAAALLLTTAAQAQVAITDIGATAPSPGADDISQLVYGNVPPTGLNYYWDSGANNGVYMGQSFTTGSNPQGYVLSSLALQTSGNGGGTSPATPLDSQSFTLIVYQLSGTGNTNATVLNSVTATGQLFVEGDWMQWTGLGFQLQPNTTYAYGFGRSPGSPADWEMLSTTTNNLYAGGQACSLPTAGGTVNYSSVAGSDATFDIGLTLPAAPIPNPPGETPAYGSGSIVAGAVVTLAASAAGSTPMYYYWQTDGGSGGTPATIPGATGTNLVVDTTGFAVGTYQYDFIASNSLGSFVSSTIGITIAKVGMVDIGTNPPAVGPDDIAQLLNTDQNDDGVNYYTDNGAGHNVWSGQTFTTGTNQNGYLLQTMSWKSAGNGNSFGNWQPYDLYFYSISANGTTATLIANYQGYGGGIENDWFQWQGLSVPLAPNTVYGYTFGRAGDGPTSSTGWEHMGDQGGNPYPGGQIMNVNGSNPTNGPVSYGNTGNSDATFSLGLVISQKPNASVPTYVPNLNPIYAGTPVTFSEVGVGTPPLTYQWLSDNGAGGSLVPVSGATSTNLLLNTAAFTAGNYKYAVIVNNTFGSSTSAPVTLTFTAPSAPVIVTDVTPSPANQGYVGQTLTFTSSFTGTLPITYQWYVDSGSGPVPVSVDSYPSAVSNVLVLSNLQLTNAGIYTVTAQNSLASTASLQSSTLSVLTPPGAPAAGTYGALVLTENPVAYWRFDEMADPSTGVLPAYDASGHNFDGVYGKFTYNGYNGFVGPQPPTFPGFESTNTALYCNIGNSNSWVNVPPLNLDTNTVTISMWINPAGAVSVDDGLLFNRNGLDAAGFCFGNTVNAAGVAELGYNWNTNSAATYNFNSGLYPPLGQWSFVALVIQTNQATIYLCYLDPNTGLPVVNSAVNPIPHSVEAFSGGTTTIGTDPYNFVSRVFDGSIDEVAVFNSAMSSDQILAQFSKAAGITGPIAASISGQPQSISTYAGHTVTLAATGINGTSPFSYQWQSNGVPLVDGGNISGSQTNTLTFTSATPANSGTYKLVVTNPVGPTPSSNAVVNIVSPAPNSYESVVVSYNPYAFWKLNETSDPSVGGVLAYDYVGGHTATYQVGAQNGFNGIVGPEAAAFPGFPASYTALGTLANTANSYVTASAGSLATNTLTYAMWINPSGPVENWAGLLMDRSGNGEGLGFGGSVNGTGMSELGYTWNDNSTWSWNSNLYPPANQWSFVAMVIEPTKATVYLINSSGVQSATNAIVQDNEEFGVAWRIGDDAAEGTAGGRTFPGSISDVSVFLSALSPSQVNALYNGGLGVVAPPNVTLYVTPAGSGKVTLTWSQGTLLQATNLTGAWTATSLTSGSTVDTTNSMMFYKVQVQ